MNSLTFSHEEQVPDFFREEVPLHQEIEMPTFEELMSEMEPQPPPPPRVPENLLGIVNSQGQIIVALNELIRELREQNKDLRIRMSRIEENVDIMTGRVEKRRESSRRNRLKKKNLDIQNKLLF